MKQSLIIYGPQGSGKTSLAMAIASIFRKAAVCWWVPGTVVPFGTELLIFDNVYNMDFIKQFDSKVEITTVSKIFITHTEVPAEDCKHFKVWAIIKPFDLSKVFKTREEHLRDLNIEDVQIEEEDTEFIDEVTTQLKQCTSKTEVLGYFELLANRTDNSVPQYISQLFRNREIELELETDINLDDLEG